MSPSHEKPPPATFLDCLSPQALRQLEREGLDLDKARRQLQEIGEDWRIDAGATCPPRPSSPKPSKKERRIGRIIERERRAARKSSRNREKDRIYLDRLQRRLNSAYGAGKAVPAPIIIPRRTWQMCWHILSDPTGHAAVIYLDRCSHQIGAQMIRRAALATDEAGRHRYTWTDRRARAVAALGLGLLQLAGKTRRPGPWNRLILGIPMGAFRAMLRDPYTGEKPARSTIAGRHKPGASVESGAVGYLVALGDSGLFYSQQVPRDVALSLELIGPSGFPTARYWLINPDPLRRQTDAERHAALELLEKELEIRRLNRRNHYAVYTTENAPKSGPGTELASITPPATGPPLDSS